MTPADDFAALREALADIDNLPLEHSAIFKTSFAIQRVAREFSLHTIRTLLAAHDAALADARQLREVLKLFGKDLERKQQMYEMMNGEPDIAIDRRLRAIDAALAATKEKP